MEQIAFVSSKTLWLSAKKYALSFKKALISQPQLVVPLACAAISVYFTFRIHKEASDLIEEIDQIEGVALQTFQQELEKIKQSQFELEQQWQELYDRVINNKIKVQAAEFCLNQIQITVQEIQSQLKYLIEDIIKTINDLKNEKVKIDILTGANIVTGVLAVGSIFIPVVGAVGWVLRGAQVVNAICCISVAKQLSEVSDKYSGKVQKLSDFLVSARRNEIDFKQKWEQREGKLEGLISELEDEFEDNADTDVD